MNRCKYALVSMFLPVASTRLPNDWFLAASQSTQDFDRAVLVTAAGPVTSCVEVTLA
jgi:hypothetical protein